MDRAFRPALQPRGIDRGGGFAARSGALRCVLQRVVARAVVLLVAAAPCALVMSTPVAMAAGIGSAGWRGILIKGGVHLEQLARVRVIAFDKTGTLTHGQPAVTDVVALGVAPNELLATAAALEHYSEHPLARAIVEHAQRAGAATPAARNFEALTGAGASAEIGETVWYIGNRVCSSAWMWT